MKFTRLKRSLIELSSLKLRPSGLYTTKPIIKKIQSVDAVFVWDLWNKQRIFPHSTLTDPFSLQRRGTNTFTARYEINLLYGCNSSYRMTVSLNRD